MEFRKNINVKNFPKPNVQYVDVILQLHNVYFFKNNAEGEIKLLAEIQKNCRVSI